MLTHVTHKTETFVIFTDNPIETNQLIFTSNRKTLVSTLEFHNGRHDIQEAVHWVKSVRIRNFSGLYFPAFGLNTERYGVSLRIQSECKKIQTRKIPNTDILLRSGNDVLGRFSKQPPMLSKFVIRNTYYTICCDTHF